MLRAGRKGWILELAAIGLDGNSTPADFSRLANEGLGVMVRINHGYGSTGTLPMPDKYPEFAAACARYVSRSKGCHIWIIGNEPNHRDEHPNGRAILPNDYANAYTLCRNAIRALPGHKNDEVLVAGPAPWNATTTYAGNEKGDWVRYFVHVLSMLDDDACDGFALHTYTHNLDASQISGNFFHTSPGYRHLRNEFRTYRDFMNVIPDRFRHLPVFITETDPTTRGIGWNPGHNIGWVQSAYREIADWNSNPKHQPILSLLLYRWPLVPDQPEWSISNRAGIIEDFNQALRAEPADRFRIRMPRKSEPLVVLEPGSLLQESEQWTGVVASPLGLNQRTGPSTDHAVLQILPNETELTVLADLDDWLYVRALDKVGYVSGAFIVRQRAGGFMPFIVSPGSPAGTDNFLRTRKELLNAELEPNEAEKFVIQPNSNNWAEQAVGKAWNQFGALVTTIAQLLEIDPAVALAVMAVESGGHAFADDGRMLIRFEVHLFFEEWGKLDPERFAQHFNYDRNKSWEGHQWRPNPNQAWRDFHGNQNAEWEVFNFARNLNPNAALRSISMGAPQIMGFNHASVGYSSPQGMFDAFAASAHAQIIALFDFINADPERLKALRTGDYTTFASSYNGPGQAGLYAALIQDGVKIFNRLRSQPNMQVNTEMNAERPTEQPTVPVREPDQDGTTGAEETTDEGSTGSARLPVPPATNNLAEIDPELYAAWRNHILYGFANNQEMFKQLVDAFMGPYHTTVQLYRLTFFVGLAAFIVAVALSAYTGEVVFGALFGGISVVAFLSYFISRPLRALEENLNFITWLGVIYNSYWTRLVYAMNMETVQQDLAAITDDFNRQIQELLDKSAELHKNRPGID